jgi:hypothetical protein
LVLLEGVQDAQTKIRIVRRNTPLRPQNGNDGALKSIVDQVVAMVGSNSPAPYPDSYLKSTSVNTNL